MKIPTQDLNSLYIKNLLYKLGFTDDYSYDIIDILMWLKNQHISISTYKGYKGFQWVG